MEVHRQYNVRSKNSNNNPTKKYFETKKTSDNAPKNVLERKNSEAPTKRTP
jgi:hypothetical protein